MIQSKIQMNYNSQQNIKFKLILIVIYGMFHKETWSIYWEGNIQFNIL